MDEQPNREPQRVDPYRARKAQKRELSAAELESGLTDICAEMYFLEAERVRTARLLSALEGGDPSADWAAPEGKWLLRQRSRIEDRLEELEAKAAGLRAEVERTRAREVG